VIIPLFDDWCVRSMTADDAEAIARYANNRHISINLRDSFPYPYTVQDARKWLRATAKRHPETAWAIASSRELVGGIGIHIQPDIYKQSAEIGYWLGEQFWKRGITTAAVKAVVEYAFTNFALTRIFAGVFEWNPVSVRVLEKAGFRCESRMRKAVVKDGKNIDQLMYVVLREEWMRTHAPKPGDD
jgi:[ribosomal protein S5]-alanine N-acetyltransferase